MSTTETMTPQDPRTAPEPPVRQLWRKLEAKLAGWRGEQAAEPAPAAEPKPAGVDKTPGTRVAALVGEQLMHRLTMLLVLSLGINVLSLAVPIFVLQVYDRVVLHAGLQTLFALTVIVALALVFDFVLRQARGRLIQIVTMNIDITISRRLFAKLAALPLRELESWTQARWRVLLRDGETVRDTVAGPATVLLIDLPFVLLFLIVIWTIAAPVAWLLLAVMPLYAGLAVVSSVMIDRASGSEQEAMQKRDALVDELVAGRAPLKAIGMTRTLRARWERLQSGLILHALKRGARVDGFSHLTTQVAMATTVLMTSVGALAIIDQQLTIGGLIAANMLAARVVQPLTRAISVWRGVSRFRRSAERLDELLAKPEEAEHSPVALQQPKGEIRLENVSFAFAAGQRPILSGLSLKLSPGLHGIVGANGAGKSTLLKTIQGLYKPDEGRVLLDSADIAQFGTRDLSSWVGLVPQDLFFIDGTIRDNIAKARPDICDDAVVRAARAAGAHGFISKLPDGYGTNMGEGGARFSAGERQLLAIARALLDRPSVLLLDEPTAHLDADATRALIGQLKRLGARSTVLVASHSPALLEACDSLMVLDGGRIAFSGKADAVLGRLGKREAQPARPTASTAA